MILTLKMFDLSIDRLKEGIAHTLELQPEYFTYHVECHVTKMPDVKEGEYEEKDDYVNFTGTYLKHKLSAVELSFTASANGDSNYDVWIVEMHVTGTNTDIRIKCETEREARGIHAVVLDYLTGKLQFE